MATSVSVCVCVYFSGHFCVPLCEWASCGSFCGFVFGLINFKMDFYLGANCTDFDLCVQIMTKLVFRIPWQPSTPTCRCLFVSLRASYELRAPKDVARWARSIPRRLIQEIAGKWLCARPQKGPLLRANLRFKFLLFSF